MALSSPGEIFHYIRSISYPNNKSKHLHKMANILIHDFNGKVPDSVDSLQLLPGVGRKTANVVLNELFGQPTIAVDTHIFRVCNRTKLAKGKTPELVEQGLIKCIPKQYKRPLHQWLIQLGRYTCVARKPKCSQCVLIELCEYPNKSL